MYIHTHTMVKVISLSEAAYSSLQGIKAETESFSDVVLRLMKKKGDILSLFGCAKNDQDFIHGIKKAYNERRSQGLRVY